MDCCYERHDTQDNNQKENQGNSTPKNNPLPILPHPFALNPPPFSPQPSLHLPRHLLQQRHIYSSQLTAPFTLHHNPRVLETPTPTHHLLQSRQVCSSLLWEYHSLFILNSHFSLFTPLNAPTPTLTSFSLGQSVRHTTHPHSPSITL